MASIKIKGTEYNLCTNLRVALELQKMKGNVAYMQILEDFNNLKLEEQLKLIYLSMKFGAEDASSLPSELEFYNYVYDGGLGTIGLMDILGTIIEGIMYTGMTEAEKEEKKAQLRAKTEARSV